MPPISDRGNEPPLTVDRDPLRARLQELWIDTLKLRATSLGLSHAADRARRNAEATRAQLLREPTDAPASRGTRC